MFIVCICKIRSHKFVLVFVTLIQRLFVGNRCYETLDFEDSEQHRCFVTTRGKISFSSFTAKHGTLSLKWESEDTGTSELRYNRPSSAPAINKHHLLRGGIKMWIYKETASKGKKLEVRFTDDTRNVKVGKFTVDLAFKGWRAIWVRYSECKEREDSLRYPAEITRVDFVLDHQDTVYIDLVEFVENMAWESRDKIVPPFTKFGPKYDASYVWRQTYRWSKQKPTELPSSIDSSKELSLAHIESRLRNWYCDEKQTSYDFSGSLSRRWSSLTRSIDKAHIEYDRLEFKTSSGKRVIHGPPLFCLRCKRGTRYYSTSDPTRKFSFIMARVLLPLALEFHLRSRGNELTETVRRETPLLNSPDPNVMQKSLRRICGGLKTRQTEFQTYLKAQGTPYTNAKVRSSLEYINKVRLQRVINVLDYLEDQGWADGSALGTLAYEMLRSRAGYMHTLFLLKDSLHMDNANKTRLVNLINTAKWYNEFGEVYQAPFEYSGTTADRMITIMLFRLLTVLTMPTNTEDEIKARQRDMEALKRWMDNTLTINKAFGGVIKPDYTGFHHMAFYASAYIPQALHTAAQVQYLLEGTDYALSNIAKSNLRRALETVRVVAVKYSSPSSVGGRFPDYSNAVLRKILPAYAYISVSHPKVLPTTPTKGITIPALTKDAEMFSRLYQPSEAIIIKYMEDGWVHPGKSYMNSLGSLEIMRKVGSIVATAEKSPQGHWSKNFAALSIHRREDWAVTVKGFNRFVWDFEGSTSKLENVHGIFQSHGAMLIANSEEALKAHDVNEGWDWTKIPGATTISLTLQETRLKKERIFSPLSLAGGVAFKGTETLSSGAFGMDFHQPDYEFLNKNHPYPNIKLYFKKSVFFYQNLLVCLGSNIRLENGSGKKAQTTLFQDKLLRGFSPFFIKVDGAQKGCSDPLNTTTPYARNGEKNYTTLVDSKGNSYYIPRSSASSLKVHIQNQTSETPSAKTSQGCYGTAWLEHSPSIQSYEYAVYIKTPSYPRTADEAWSYQENDTQRKLYEVLKQDDEAHVVKFGKAPERWSVISPLYGYVIFRPTAALPLGPIMTANKHCRILVCDSTSYLYLSISYPDLNFPDAKVLKSLKDIKAREMYDLESKEIQVEVTLATNVETSLPTTPMVHGSPINYIPVVKVESSSSSPPNKGNKIVFANLRNGFSVEIKLKK
ncbi:hypothetical protein ACROYT_G043912 [Oculina patagonica]